MNWNITGFQYNDYTSYHNPYIHSPGASADQAGLTGTNIGRTGPAAADDGTGRINPGAGADSSGRTGAATGINGSGTTGAAAGINASGRTGAATSVNGTGRIDPSSAVGGIGRTGTATGTSRSGRTDGTRPIDPDNEKKPGRRSTPAECETCKKRKYQDGSDESNVSFKSAAHISPNEAGTAVRAHENMHVQNAYKKAAQKNGKVLSATVAIHTAICPECGRTYVSGGVTRTAIRYGDESNPYQQDKKSQDHGTLAGANLDTTV